MTGKSPQTAKKATGDKLGTELRLRCFASMVFSQRERKIDSWHRLRNAAAATG
jgi:hypothetical protein